MRGFNALVTAMILTVTAAAYAKAPVKSKAKAAAAVQAQLQAEIRKLTDERDELKDRLAATGNLQEDLAAAQKSRDLARQEADGVGFGNEKSSSSAGDVVIRAGGITGNNRVNAGWAGVGCRAGQRCR